MDIRNICDLFLYDGDKNNPCLFLLVVVRLISKLKGRIIMLDIIVDTIIDVKDPVINVNPKFNCEYFRFEYKGIYKIL